MARINVSCGIKNLCNQLSNLFTSYFMANESPPIFLSLIFGFQEINPVSLQDTMFLRQFFVYEVVLF